MEGRTIAGTIEYLCPIYKKGDALDCRNYRGISLLCTSYKILSNVLLNRLIPYTQEIVGEYQAGITKGKSTMDQIQIAKQLMEKSYKFNQDLFILFNDYKQAYESIIRESLWAVMLKFGIPEKMVKLIQTYTKSSKCRVRYNPQMSEEFNIDNGLRQGDAPSPMLFNIALKYVVRAVLEFNTGVKIQENTEVTIVAYADDIMIVAESEANLKTTTSNLMEKSKDMGLIINESKTKYMILS